MAFSALDPALIIDLGSPSQPGEVLLHVLLALAVVIVLAQALGALLRQFNQPSVVGEILAGIMVGPSLLGWAAPSLFAYVFPAPIVPLLAIVAQAAIILYMFLVGLELDTSLLRQRPRDTAAISESSIAAPFILGALLAMLIYPRGSSPGMPAGYLALFLGLAMATTAFPVLARILTDRHLHQTPIGVIALRSAALADFTAWCLLALLLCVLHSRVAGSLLTAAMAASFLILMILVVRPAMARLSLLYGNRGRLTQGVMATIFVTLLGCALAARLIGIHPLFGAFALGAVMPHDSGMARDLTDLLEDLVVVLLLPAFFALTGLRTDIGLLGGGSQWLLFGLIMIAASIGKFGGSLVAARACGMGWRDGCALGVLMNTRGLMELIVLALGLELKIISPALFTMLVLMTLLTTCATAPVLDFLVRPRPQAKAVAPAARARPTTPLIWRTELVVAISNPEGVGYLLDVALAANRPGDPPPHVIALARRPLGGVRSGLREVEQRVAPQVPALSAALDYVHAQGAAVTSQAIWTDDPAVDILRVAREAQSGWLLIGAHHSVFGSDFRGGVVRSVVAGAEAQASAVNLAVVIPGPPRPLDRVFAVVDGTSHGRAVLDLGIRLAKKNGRSLHVILVPRRETKPDVELLAMVKGVGRAQGLRVHTDVLAGRSGGQLARQAPGPLVIVGTNLVDELNLLHGAFGKDRHCVVVVQGNAMEQSASAVERAGANSKRTG